MMNLDIAKYFAKESKNNSVKINKPENQMQLK